MKVLAFLAAAYVALLTPDFANAGMLAQAQQYKGLHEVKNNKTLRAALGINPARTPWCGHFMGMVARKAGELRKLFTLHLVALGAEQLVGIVQPAIGNRRPDRVETCRFTRRLDHLQMRRLVHRRMPLRRRRQI